MLQFVELVEIFHQFLLFLLLKAEDVAFREFVRVICDRFIDITGLNGINGRNITVEKHASASDFDDQRLDRIC